MICCTALDTLSCYVVALQKTVQSALLARDGSRDEAAKRANISKVMRLQDPKSL